MGEALALVVNPRAGAGAARRRRSALEAALRTAGFAPEARVTEGPGHATELVRDALAAGAKGVAVVGGDGTLNEAVNAFFDDAGQPVATGAWLAPLAVGTGGDFGRTLGRVGMVPMVERLRDAAPRPIDAGWMTATGHDGSPVGRAFLNVASFGLGGRVDRLVAGAPKVLGGRVAFFVASLGALLTYRRQPVRLTADDRPPRDARIQNLAVANGRFFGGGMEVAPRARLDDGLLDVVGLEMPAAALVALAPALYRGRHLERGGVTFVRARRLLAEPLTDEPVLIDLDGEMPGRLPATFEVRPAALHLRG